MKYMLFIILILSTSAFAQDESNTIGFDSKPLSEILEGLEKEFGVHFYYKPEWAIGTKKSVEVVNTNDLNKVLGSLFRGTNLTYHFLDSKTIVLFNVQNEPENRYKVTFSGTITDALTNEPVPNVNIQFENSESGTVSNVNGQFDIEIDAGEYVVDFKSLQYDEQQFIISLFDDFTKDIVMFQNTLELDNINITANKPEDNLTEVQPGKIQVELESIRKLPSFLGEVDVTKVITSLPGVQSVGEGTSGFNVRGGGTDENLISMDGIPIYNSSHLFGFFSIFNPDAIKNFSLLKGGFPAQHGGRLSSVLQIDLKNPIIEPFEVGGGVGPIVSKLTASIPLKQLNAGVFLSGRISYPTWILKKVKDADIRQSSARFYDITSKIAKRIGDKDILTITSYASNDEFNISADSTFQYSNLASSIKWSKNLNNKLDLESAIYFANYEASILDMTYSHSFLYTNGLSTYGGRSILSVSHNEYLNSNIGVNYKSTTYHIGKQKPEGNSSINNKQLPKEKNSQLSGFYSLNKRFNQNLSVEAGLRLTLNYLPKGSKQYLFDPTRSRSELTIEDTIQYNSSQMLDTDWQPRVSVNYRLNRSSSVKFNYSRSYQYEFRYSSSTASLPTDLWKPTDINIRPASVNAYSSGYFLNFKDDRYESSIEFYYKDFDHLNLLKTGTDVLLNDMLITDIVQGEGFSYGMEVYLKKNAGTLTGWLSYFYSKTKNRTTGSFRNEQITGNEYFLADFDRPHNFNLSASLKLSRLWTVSTNFFFSSGRPVTLPTSSYVIDKYRIFDVESRNNYRINDSHRLDLSVTFEGSNKRNNKFSSSVTFSLYNVYARKNPYSVYTTSLNNAYPRTVQLSIIGTVIPSITYNFKFK
jgi:hypothetical protein